MKIRKYIIIDDSEDDAYNLTQYLNKIPFLRPAGVYPSIQEAIDVLTRESIDLVLLDIALPQQSGLSLLKSGIALPPVIITSAYPEFALESYEIGKAADYLLKPFTLDRLLTGVNRALMIQATLTSFKEIDFVFLKMGRKVQRFDFHLIDYVEAYGLYSKVFVGNQISVVNERLMALTELLPARQFIRVHKSYLINVTKITGYDRQALWIDQTKIPIGAAYRPQLEGLLRLFDNTPESNES